MSDYTPTTEEVRRGLLTGYVSDSEFDRWLESIMQKAHIAERERIIKIIELNVAYLVAVCDGGNKNILEIEEIIELIKGENK